ncbi:MAG: hypothetical protein ACI88H_001926 [Cocleimonas sp.]|jgi:hypothetical protein
MIRLADIARRYRASLLQHYSDKLRPDHHRTLQHIIDCHTPACGMRYGFCKQCNQSRTSYPSCGDRHCPSCQYQTNSDWLERQRAKLLPTDYFMVTFTLPYQLRAFAWHHQAWTYNMLFQAAVATLNSFFKRDKKLGDMTGMIGVLHTHSRKLDYHPHVHFIVPSGSLSNNKRQWQTKSGGYLFKADNLACVFRDKFITLMSEDKFTLPTNTPKSWIADCKLVGQGDPALTYLSRYLYRGVITERNIVALRGGLVTFKYQDSNSKKYKYITEPAAQFLWRVLQHVLPKGFRRSRDYGFLHGNARRTLQRIQLLLKVILIPRLPQTKKPICYPCCKEPILILWVYRTRQIMLKKPHI